MTEKSENESKTDDENKELESTTQEENNEEKDEDLLKEQKVEDI